MKESAKYLFSVGVLLLMLPFLLTVILSGKGAVSVSKDIDIEMLLPVRLYQEIPEDAEAEMIKAQAILARSRLYRELSEGGNAREILCLLYTSILVFFYDAAGYFHRIYPGTLSVQPGVSGSG